MATATTGSVESSAAAAPVRSIGTTPLRSASAASRIALYALLLRDLTVLRKHAL
jgi:hypothetical protein